MLENRATFFAQMIMREFGVKAQAQKNNVVIEIDPMFGAGSKQAKIDHVEELKNQIADYIRKHKEVFDLTCDITGEEIVIKFIG